MPKELLIQIGLFKFEKKINITGRGLVLVGQIIDGRVIPGNSIHLDMGELSFKILGVSVGHRHSENFVALNIALENTLSENDFDKFIGKVFTICR